LKLIDAQIEKEIAEGTFYKRPDVRELLEKSKKEIDEYQKSLETPPSFGKSPQE